MTEQFGELTRGGYDYDVFTLCSDENQCYIGAIRKGPYGNWYPMSWSSSGRALSSDRKDDLVLKNSEVARLEDMMKAAKGWREYSDSDNVEERILKGACRAILEELKGKVISDE